MKCTGVTCTKEYEYSTAEEMLKHKDKMITAGWVLVTWNTVLRIAIYVKTEELINHD